jgi:hypothetical protein
VFVSAVSPSGVTNSRQPVIIDQQPLPPPAILKPVCPDSVDGNANTPFDVTIEISGVTGLFGVGFDLNFDPSVLNAMSTAAGPFLGSDVLFPSNIDNAKGKVGVGLSKKAGLGGADGSGVLATIRFKLIRNAERDTTLNFTLSDISAHDSAMFGINLLADSASIQLKSFVVGIITADAVKPAVFYLSQNTPNPFNPTTTIRYAIPKPCDVTLEVFDGLGRLIATLFKGHREAGEHLAVFDSKRLSSGLYYCRLDAGGSTMTRKMLLIR